MGILTRLDRTGHSQLAEWAPENKAQVLSAEQLFNELSKNHVLADISDGPEGKQITKFDPEATEIVAIPPFTGG